MPRVEKSLERKLQPFSHVVGRYICPFPRLLVWKVMTHRSEVRLKLRMNEFCSAPSMIIHIRAALVLICHRASVIA